MPNRLVGFYLSEVTNASLVEATDAGLLVAKLAGRGLGCVALTKGGITKGESYTVTYSTGSGLKYITSEFDRNSVVVIRNPVAQSIPRHLDGVPCLNSTAVLRAATKAAVAELASVAWNSWGARFPKKVVSKKPDANPHADNGARLYAYVVKNDQDKVIIPVANTKDGFVDVELSDEVSDYVNERANRIAEGLANRAQADHLIGVFVVGQLEGKLITQKANFHNPSLPTTSEAPQAAKMLNDIVAGTLVSMSHAGN